MRSWDDAKALRHEALRPLARRRCSRAGVYWPPSQFEAAFLSGAHTEADIDATVLAAEESL